MSSEIGQRGRQGLSGPRRIAVDAAGRGIGGVLAALAVLRGRKPVHPHGVAYEARLVMDGARDAPAASALLGRRQERRAIVRFSRSLGLPRPLPDLLGLSIRVPDAYGPARHQDFLLATSVDAPVLHHLFLPAADAQQRPYTSSLPYRAGARTFLVGALPQADSPRMDGHDEFERLDRAVATGGLHFALAIAPLGGRFRRVGSIHLDRRSGQDLDALCFDPFHCGGGLEPVGVLNRLRDYAYPLSQRAWGRRRDGVTAQRRADAQALVSAPRPSSGERAASAR